MLTTLTFQEALDEVAVHALAKLPATLQELRTEWTFNDENLSLAHAVAVFPFGIFEDSGDATRDNVNRKVAPHFRRVALTRASARALRLALGVEVCSVEELDLEVGNG